MQHALDCGGGAVDAKHTNLSRAIARDGLAPRPIPSVHCHARCLPGNSAFCAAVVVAMILQRDTTRSKQMSYYNAANENHRIAGPRATLGRQFRAERSQGDFRACNLF